MGLAARLVWLLGPAGVLAHKEPLGQRTVTSGRWLNGLGVERIDRQLAAAAVSAGLLPGRAGGTPIRGPPALLVTWQLG